MSKPLKQARNFSQSERKAQEWQDRQPDSEDHQYLALGHGMIVSHRSDLCIRDDDYEFPSDLIWMRFEISFDFNRRARNDFFKDLGQFATDRDSLAKSDSNGT
jgi:hypothetical protein